MSSYHVPVLGKEIVRFMEPENKGWIVDGTLGDGGHTELLLKQSGPGCKILAMDQDTEALNRARKRLAPFSDRVTLVHGNFKEAKQILHKHGINTIDGFLLDLGVSSRQFDTAELGFSFSKNGPLDMRMNSKTKKTAADLLTQMSDSDLIRVLRDYGEERFSKRIVRAIRKAQASNPIQTTLQLSQIITDVLPVTHPARIHSATRTFQALRIAVNDELESLKIGLRGLLGVLNKAGRALVISFHSLEDRIVKNLFRELEKGCTCPPQIPVCICGKQPTLKVLSRRPIQAQDRELKENPRSSSAKLRVGEKINV